MTLQGLRERATSLDQRISQHQQQAQLHSRSLLQRWRESGGMLAPAAGALTGAAFALVPLRVFVSQAWHWSALSAGPPCAVCGASRAEPSNTSRAVSARVQFGAGPMRASWTTHRRPP